MEKIFHYPLLKSNSSLSACLLLIVLLTGMVTAHAQTAKWNVNGNGNWGSTTVNAPWASPGTPPNGVSAFADIRFNISSTRVITLDINPTIGTLVLGDTNNNGVFVIGSGVGSGTLTFDNGGLANANNGDVLGAFFNHNSGTSGISPSSSDRIDANVQIDDVVGLIIDADRSLEFRGAWSGNGTNALTLLSSNGSNRLNDARFYWNASGSNLGELSNLGTLNIINGEARFDGVAGTANSQLIGATTINLGNGVLQRDSDVFPRLYLVNTETTQTANLNVNGGWLVSDLGNNDLTIWSGAINFTGAANTNIVDVNDAGTGDQHAVSGVIGGTGGFSKINTGTLRLEADNTIQGNIYIQRNGVGGTNIDSTVSRGGIRLTTATGALSAVNSVVISRDGSFYLNSATDVNLNRVNDSAGLTLRGQGRIRLIGNAGSAVSETMGALYVDTGSGKINFDLDDTTPQLTTFTFASFTRDPGSIAQFQVLDNTPNAFGSLLGGNARLFISDVAGAVKYGGGTGNNTTTKSIVKGAFGGVNNISNHFMTFDSVNTTELRPLDFDTEYLQSSRLPVKGIVDGDYTVLYGVNQNFMLNYNVTRAGDPDGDVNWFANNPNRITVNVGMNSIRFGTNTPTNGVNTNELGSALVLNADVILYLGDSLGANNGVGFDTNGSGMILFGREGASPE